jgi:hypothetical protein
MRNHKIIKGCIINNFLILVPDGQIFSRDTPWGNWKTFISRSSINTFKHTTHDTDTSVGIALGYGLGDRDSTVRFPAGAGNFFHHRIQNGLGPTQPPIQWVPGTPSLGVKRLGREADHSYPSSAEVKEWVALFLHSPIRFHGVVLG